MSDITYYMPENMQGKKISDMKDDNAFMEDAVAFLRSKRKGYDASDFADMSRDDVVSEVLEHFRVSTTNEMTMARDYSFVSDDTIPEKDRQAYGRLLFAFDNAEGEGLLDRGGEKIFDYAEGILTAPSTLATVAAGAFTGGTGGVAVQASKIAAQQGVRKVASNLIGRSLLAAGIDGSIGAAAAFGEERKKQIVGEDIDEDYEVNWGTVAMSGGIGAVTGGAGYYVPNKLKRNAANRLRDSTAIASQARNAEKETAANRAEEYLKLVTKEQEGKKLAKFTQDKILAAIDPKLVKEGMDVKVDILSEGLEEGLIGGLDRSTMLRLSAASYELASRLKIKPEKGQRITEYLARAIDTDGKHLDVNNVIDDITSKYQLTRRQLSAVYAAEVSEAAKILRQQRDIKSFAGTNIERVDAKKFVDRVQKLYDDGLSTIDGEDAAKAMDPLAEHSGIFAGSIRAFKDVEGARRAFMTSQPATTMRNTIFGLANVGIDTLDQLNLAVVKTLRGKEGAYQTARGAADTAAFLSKDFYVAEMATEILRQDAPALMAKMFQDAASAEANLMRDTGLSKAGRLVNSFNTLSDHTFKKAVLASSLNRQLRQQGTTLYDVMKSGRFSEEGVISDEMLNQAIKDSQAFVFQRNFGGKDASMANKAAKETVDFINKSGLTVLIPFPRYMASQAKFISDYTGMTLIRRAVAGKGLDDEALSKLMTGSVMFAGLYSVQKDNIENGLEWYEGLGTDDKVYNAQAALGPAAAHAWSANLVARVMNGEPTKGTGELLKELGKITVGSEFRPTGTLFDKVGQATDAGDLEPLMTVVGDYFSSFTYPAAALKDLYGQFDPRSAYLPELRDANINMMYDFQGTTFDISMNLYNRITRQLPDFNTKVMLNTLKETTGIELDPANVKGLLEFFNSSSRTVFQTQYSGSEDTKDTGYDMIRFDIFGEGPLRMYDPLEKQVFGLVGQAPKNALKKEMSRLQIDPFKVYNPYTEKNPAVALLTEQLLQGNMAREMETVINSNYYNSLSSEEKKEALINGTKGNGWEIKGIKDYVSDTKKHAESLLKDMALPENIDKYKGDFVAYTKGRLAKVSSADKQRYNLNFKREMYNNEYFKDLTFEEARDKLKADDTLSKEELDVREANLIDLFIRVGKDGPFNTK